MHCSSLCYHAITHARLPAGAHWSDVHRRSVRPSVCLHARACMRAGLQTATLALTLAGSVSEFTPPELSKVKESLAKAAGVSESAITLNVQPGSVVLQATMPSSAAARVQSQYQEGALKTLGRFTVEKVATLSSLTARTLAPAPPFATYSPTVPLTGAPLKLGATGKPSTAAPTPNYTDSVLDKKPLGPVPAPKSDSSENPRPLGSLGLALAAAMMLVVPHLAR